MGVLIFIVTFVWCMAMYEVFEGKFWTAMFMGILGGIFINVIAATFAVAVGV